MLIDALGTLIELSPPGPALARELRERGVEVSPEQAARAFQAEIAYYRANHLRGRDGASLTLLREDCAGVLHAALPARARDSISPRELEPAMLAALEFRAYPDAGAALRSVRVLGLRVLVLSNWDVSLHGVLAQVGLAPELDGILSSAEAGAAKPDPRAFRAVLELAGAPAARAVHVGDSYLEDVAGARSAGIAAILLHRDTGGPSGEVSERGLAVISSLSELPGRLAQA